MMDAWFPVIPGWDIAGVVGAGMTEFAEGDEVIGFVREAILHHGTYAENASVPASGLVREEGEPGTGCGASARCGQTQN